MRVCFALIVVTFVVSGCGGPAGGGRAGNGGTSGTGDETGGTDVDTGTVDVTGSDTSGETDTGTVGTDDTGTAETDTTGTEDTGTEDTGTEDTGTEETGTEDTGTEDTGEPPTGDACVGGSDSAILETQDVSAAALTCALGCIGQDEGCVEKCVWESTGLSTGCAQCVGELANCGLSNCVAQCAADPGAADCLACQQESGCFTAFEECAGVVAPVPDPPDPVEGCAGVEDQFLLLGGKVTPKALTCAINCVGTDPACAAVCIADETGLSDPCASCYSELAACIFGGCLAQCFADPGSTTCLSCQGGAGCTSAFETCATVEYEPPPPLGGCEPFCQPGWECGPDGCGGTCGTGCFGGEVCNNAKHTCEDNGGCEPFCQPGWECGPDGCGGVCGPGCGFGELCNNAKHSCDTFDPPPDLSPFGGECQRGGDCQPFVNTPSGSVDNPAWPACMNAKCETGQCFEPACTKSCTLTKDIVDAEGNVGPDGIDDPDAPFDDCQGAVDGWMGEDYTCIAFAPPGQGMPVNFCVPGTTFKPCANNSDCPGTETCQLQYILGAYSTRCAAAPKGAATIGEFCNRNPDEGDVTYCETRLCFGPGCTGFCESDEDCGTNAMVCLPDFEIFGDSNPDITFPICWGKPCDSNADCPGDEHFCRINFNGEYDEGAAWEHYCASAAPDAAAVGEACEDDATDAIPKPPCAGPCLNNGTCSAICQADSDCAAGGDSMKCNANASGVDYNNDDVDDQYLPLGLCVDFPGTQTPCGADTDCAGSPTPEACDYFSFFQPDGAMDATGICTETKPGEGDVGDACGGSSGVTCKSGFCLGSQGDQPGFCTALCSKKSDCPAGPQTLGLFAGTYNMFCFAYLYSNGLDVTTPEDTVYVPLCRPVVSEVSPLDDCSADLTCTGADQACQAIAIAVGATGPTSVEYLCFGAGFNDALGDFKLSTADLGDACDITFESSSPSQHCKSNYCLPGAGDDKGYCSKLCATDEDCSEPNMKCEDLVLIDRKGTAQDVTTQVCKKDD